MTGENARAIAEARRDADAILASAERRAASLHAEAVGLRYSHRACLSVEHGPSVLEHFDDLDRRLLDAQDRFLRGVEQTLLQPASRRLSRWEPRPLALAGPVGLPDRGWDNSAAHASPDPLAGRPDIAVISLPHPIPERDPWRGWLRAVGVAAVLVAAIWACLMGL